MQRHQDQELYGINKKLYKRYRFLIQNQQRIITVQKVQKHLYSISDNVFLPNQPQLNAPNDNHQTVHIPKHNILQQTLRRQVQSVIFAETYINQIVYDSKDPSPYTKDTDPATLGIDVLPYYLPKNKQDTVLIFESRFQCGNLRRVIQKYFKSHQDPNTTTDFNTNGHTQWYYFSVANTRKNVQYRFNIINLLKPDSLYNVGMKPLIYSQRTANSKNIGWVRQGNDICYFTSNLKRKTGGYYSSLTFTLKFEHDFDTVYIAHCYPYSYTKLQKYIKGLENDVNKRNKFQKKFLCLTQSGNNCDYIVIGGDNNKQKKAIIVTARVHPGQTMSSYIVQSIIDILLGNSPLAKSLRQNFVFKIIPMLNVDGVIVGNYRCNLSGADLNRQYIQPSKKLHPTIYFTKQLIKSTKTERQLGLTCDIHGHNRKKNAFIYGCTTKQNSKKQQVFPMLMKNNSSIFNFKDCCFEVQKDREGAARIALWKQLNIVNCFTLEVSFCGSDFGKYEYYHFNPLIYKELALAFCQSIQDYYESSQTKVKKVIEQLQNFTRNPKQDLTKDSQDSDYSGDENQIIPKQTRQSKEKDNNRQNKKSADAKQPRDNTAQKIQLKKKFPPSLKPKKK